MPNGVICHFVIFRDLRQKQKASEYDKLTLFSQLPREGMKNLQ
jgi:hypothetical protein